MSWTKRQLVEQAYEEIGYASYAYDLDPQQLQSALRKLDSYVAHLNNKGVRLSYPLPRKPENSDLDDRSNMPDEANEAIYLNLAIRLAPSVGKTVGTELKQAAYQAYISLLASNVMPNEQQITDLPRGAGAKAHDNVRGPFLDDANTDPLQIEDGGNLQFN